MELKNKVFEQLVVNNLFGKNYNTAFNRITKEIKISDKMLSLCLSKLYQEKIIKLKNKKYICALQPVAGKIHGNKNKFYIEISNPQEFIKISNVNGAQDGDEVSAYIVNDGSNRIAIVNKILQKQDEVIFGRVVKLKSNAIVLIDDDNNKFLLPNDEATTNLVGKKVSVKIEQERKGQIPLASIVKVYGNADDPIVENVVIAEKHGFKKHFNSKIEKELEQIPENVEENDIVGRVDLRKLNIVTIDPITCKDMDDAVYVEKTDNGYRLVGAIADVGHYVKIGSELDKEAYKRGTSCYLGDGVYPMLPEKLSNGICSLNEKVDRLAITVAIDFDNNGNRLRYSIKPAVINSKHKLSYNVVDQIYLKQNDMHNKFADINKEINLMFELADLLTMERNKRGAIMVNTQEPDYDLDETKTNVENIENHSSLISTKIIEAFMLAMNEAIGDYFKNNDLLTLRRVHYAPNDFQIDELNQVLKQFDLPLVTKDVNSYHHLIDVIKNKNYEEYVTYKLLKSLQKAFYSPEMVGHFGLASKDYIQFTSPIRRYPDLVAHRILYSYLTNKNYIPSIEQLEVMGLHLSKKELDAKDAEIESNNLMNAIWAENHIGEKFEAKIFDIEPTKVVVKCDLIMFNIPMHEFNRMGYKCDVKKQELVRYDGTKLKITDNIPIVIKKADRTKREITATCDFERENKLDNSKTY